MLGRIKKFWKHITNPIIGEVWEFHRITRHPSKDARYAPYDITPDRLESIIKEHQEKGCRFVSIDSVCDMLQSMQHQSYLRRLYTALSAKRFICVTLDDGYEDNYTNAYPIFVKYGIPFCIYITTSYIGSKFLAREDTPSSLKEWQIKEMDSNPLCTIGAHTKTHPNMAQLSEEQQREELVDSVNVLEQLIGKKVNHITIPYGSYNRITWRMISELKVRSNVRGWGGAVRMNTHPHDIPRIIIEHNKKTY